MSVGRKISHCDTYTSVNLSTWFSVKFRLIWTDLFGLCRIGDGDPRFLGDTGMKVPWIAEGIIVRPFFSNLSKLCVMMGRLVDDVVDVVDLASFLCSVLVRKASDRGRDSFCLVRFSIRDRKESSRNWEPPCLSSCAGVKGACGVKDPGNGPTSSGSSNRLVRRSAIQASIRSWKDDGSDQIALAGV